MERVFRHLVQAGRVLFGRINARRNLTVFEDDTFLVSYPRSGNTWTRFLIANLMHPDDPATFLNIDSRIPYIYEYPDRVLRGLPKPRILKSHEYFDPRYKKVIYIVRDPRDVAVSDYHHTIKYHQLPEGYPLDEFIPRFIEGEFEAWMKGPAWNNHVLSWLCTHEDGSSFMVLRYEDMKEDPMRELARLRDFLGISAPPERLTRVLELSSARRMRALEKEQARKWTETKRSRQDKPFIRNAVSGGWKSTLSREAVSAIEAAWGPVMNKLGYELCTEVGRRCPKQVASSALLRSEL